MAFASPRAAQAPAPHAASGTQPPARTSTIADRTAGMQKLDGYLPLYLGRAKPARCGWRSQDQHRDARTPQGWPPASDRTTSASIAVRAALAASCLSACRAAGPDGAAELDLQLEQHQPGRAKRVEDSFAKSVLWGFTVGAETDGHVLVDATDFLLRDAANVTPRLRPGTYRVDRTRSAFDMPRTKAFPKNTEVEMILTFANEAGGGGGRGAGGPVQGPPPVGATFRRSGGPAAACFRDRSPASRHPATR